MKKNNYLVLLKVSRILTILLFFFVLQNFFINQDLTNANKLENFVFENLLDEVVSNAFEETEENINYSINSKQVSLDENQTSLELFSINCLFIDFSAPFVTINPIYTYVKKLSNIT